MPDFNKISYDADVLQAEVLKIKQQKFSVSKEDLTFILQSIDLTSLEGSDTHHKIKSLCYKASGSNNKLPLTAAVCVYPVFIKTARDLKNTNIKIAAVAGGFPAGQIPLKIKLEEVKYAVNEGADEIDMVISRGKLLEGKHDEVLEEICAIREVCKNVTLKVILETGELDALEKISTASQIAMQAGADFIKTSTGKISVNATLEAVCVMLYEIKNFYEKSGKKIGIKPSGGISDSITASQYIQLTENILGKSWLNPQLFRFGASRLYDSVLSDMGLGVNTKPSGSY